ncbi:MAG: putative RDD family membrane protein YckC [Candidatus Azotimanducaceae bacterium]|jgi:uncharacterized RDD family membrane protein YckC
MTDSENLEYAGFWVRVGAAIIDSILLLMVTFPILVWIYGWAYFDSGALIEGPADFIISWILPAFTVVLFWIYRQATPGKMAYDLRIVDARTGQPPSKGQNILRYFAYFVSTIPLGLGLIWVGIDRRKQGWHDLIAKTVVVRSKTRGPAPVRFE